MIQSAAVTASLSDITTRARKALSDSPIYLLRQIEVETSEDGLVLSGKVDSFYHKQLAQEVVLAVAGGIQISNVVSVQWPAQ